MTQILQAISTAATESIEGGLEWRYLAYSKCRTACSAPPARRELEPVRCKTALQTAIRLEW